MPTYSTPTPEDESAYRNYQRRKSEREQALAPPRPADCNCPLDAPEVGEPLSCWACYRRGIEHPPRADTDTDTDTAEVREGNVVTVRDEDRSSDPGPWTVIDISEDHAELWAAWQETRREPIADLQVVLALHETDNARGDDDE